MRARQSRFSYASGWVALGLAFAPDLDVGPGPACAADAPWIARGAKGMVAADSEFASQAGLEMLRAGGNVIDAAVATSFALAVTRPYSTGLGGGGFMIARLVSGGTIVQDFRETAPREAKANMYERRYVSDPSVPRLSEFGHLAVAVPGLVAGRCEALTKWGTMPRDKVLAPAIRLASGGFKIDDDHLDHAQEALEIYQKYPSLKDSCGFVYRTYVGGGTLPKVGDTLTQPALGKLLEGIAAGGPEFFYNGPVALAIERDMRQNDGIITGEDLAQYEPKLRKPLVISYRDYRLLLMPSPSSGGIALAQTLNTLEALNFVEAVKRDPLTAVHLQIEALKHAFADRSRHLGDQDFAGIPLKMMTSKSYAKELADRIRSGKILDPKDYGMERMPDDSGTSHFCVVDSMGNYVVSTETINTTFGSLAAVEEWGLILNNEMDDFSTLRDKPNAFGLVQSVRNSVGRGKRPLSSMSPTIVMKDDQPVLLLGGSGGPRIISSVLNVLLGVTDLGLSLEDAIQRIRPHHQWLPDEVYFDREPPADLAQALTSREHKIAHQRKTGVVQAILHTPDGWIGASDPRKGGKPAGY